MSILEVRGVSKRFGSLEALRDVSFEVKEGALYGIAGPNGAGKSVLFNVISGVYRPSSGEVRFGGENIVGVPAHGICHRGLVRTFQTASTFHSMSVKDNVRVGGLFGAGTEDRVPMIMELLEIAPMADVPATNLELFTLKKVVLGAALATDCKVLMLDEPMAGLSLVEIERYLELVRRVNQEWGITVLIVEHLLDVLIDISERMMILHYGEVLYEGSPDEVKGHEEVATVYLGETSTEKRRA
jgi:branched-chain amino acid transport system ATP-binding protein